MKAHYGEQKTKESKQGEVTSFPKCWLMTSLVVLAVAAAYHVPTATAWMPLSRTSSQRQTFSGGPSSLAFAPSLKQQHKTARKSPIILYAKDPSEEGEEEDEEFEWEEIEYSDDEDSDDGDDGGEDEETIEEESALEEESELEEDEAATEDEEEEGDDDDDDDEAVVDEEEEILAAKSLDEAEEAEAWEAEEELVEEVQSLEGTTSVGPEWDDDDEVDLPLDDDPDDPDYQKQKQLLENAVSESDRVGRDRNFDAMNFMMNEMTDEMMTAMDEMPFIKEAKERAKSLEVTETDIEGIDLAKEIEQTSELFDDEYPRHEEGEENFLEQNIGLSDDDMEQADRVFKLAREKHQEESWDRVALRGERGFSDLSNETIEEMQAAANELGGASAYNLTKWLLYDLDFNVTNLMLAAVKHNRESPILFRHWYPQLVTYSRYADAQSSDFDFSWENVESADISELERYYQGMGYDTIPEKAPSESGIIEFDYLDEEEIKMAAFEAWYTDVYNPEWDRKDFDDDDMKDEDNVFSPYFEERKHPDIPARDKLEAWAEIEEEDEEDEQFKKIKDMYYPPYEIVDDKEFEEEFRGHLVVACTGDDLDLEIAEKITVAMNKAHGKQVYVETQIQPVARLEDNVFEVWLESYEIELLHSKKRATSGATGWDGPIECDDKQVDYLVDRVGFLISDDARYSYSVEVDGAV